MNKINIKKAYLNISAQIIDVQDKIDNRKNDLRYLEAKLEDYEEIRQEFEKFICKNCHGHGQIRHQIYQDESRIETCNVCNGTGLAKE